MAGLEGSIVLCPPFTSLSLLNQCKVNDMYFLRGLYFRISQYVCHALAQAILSSNKGQPSVTMT